MERDAIGVDYVPVERGAEPVLVLDASPELEEVACGEPPAVGGIVGVNDPRHCHRSSRWLGDQLLSLCLYP